MLHGYCIRLEGEPGPAGISGIDGSRVEVLDSAGLSVWFSRVADDRPTAERLREHERVVRSALRSATPLPLRFGSRFAHEEELAHHLSDRSEELTGMLHRFAGRVEMGIRIGRAHGGETPAEPERESMAEVTGSGRAYLEAKRLAHESAATSRTAVEELLHSIAAEVASISDEYRIESDPTPGSMGSMAHLLHRRGVPLYRSTLLEVQKRRPDLKISVSGPWAPYSFV